LSLHNQSSDESQYRYERDLLHGITVPFGISFPDLTVASITGAGAGEIMKL
jgi:hypothetical protein